MFEKILVAYDGSVGARRALDVAIKLASIFRAELWTLSVEERLPHYAATIDEMQEEQTFANRYFQEALSVAYLRAMHAGVELKSEIRAGDVVRTIIEFAREGSFDLLVSGASKHSKAWAMFLGTTAEKMSEQTPCTILIIR
jgi:nucleotide-binding universal stress UspA family protein